MPPAELLHGAGAADVSLREGGTLRLRPPVHDDADALVAFLAGLSEHCRYLRFHGMPPVGRGLVEPFLDPDWAERGALVGILGERIVALGNYARLPDSHAAEIGFVVADGEERHGIGTLLLERLAERATGAGISCFVADVMADNLHSLNVFAAAGFERAGGPEAGELVLRRSLEPRSCASARPSLRRRLVAATMGRSPARRSQ